MVYQRPLAKKGVTVNLLDLSIYFETFCYPNTYYPAYPSIHLFIMYHCFQDCRGMAGGMRSLPVGT